jgi:hypothetical protein
MRSKPANERETGEFAHITKRDFSRACNLVKKRKRGIASHARTVSCFVDLACPTECGVRKSCNNLQQVFRGVSGLVSRLWAGLRARYAPCQAGRIRLFGGLDRRESSHVRIRERPAPSNDHGRIEAIDGPASFLSQGRLTPVSRVRRAFSNHSEDRKPRMGA